MNVIFYEGQTIPAETAKAIIRSCGVECAVSGLSELPSDPDELCALIEPTDVFTGQAYGAFSLNLHRDGAKDVAILLTGLAAEVVETWAGPLYCAIPVPYAPGADA